MVTDLFGTAAAPRSVGPPVARDRQGTTDGHSSFSSGAGLSRRTDMAKRKPTLSQQLRRLALRTDQLERSNRDLDEFVSVVTHDLQAPLRAIVAFCQLLQERQGESLTGEAKEYISCVTEAGRRMQQLIDDLRAYARVTHRPQALLPVDCQVALSDALANLKVEIDRSGATVTHKELPVLPGDKTQLTQLFQNLVDNAIKYRGERPPEVHISAAKTRDCWRFSVRDNGIGFDQKHANQIFRIFRRLHTDEERFHGTGVGLAICKRIVSRHGGRISVRSTPGEGSVFSFTIPTRTGNGNGH